MKEDITKLYMKQQVGPDLETAEPGYANGISLQLHGAISRFMQGFRESPALTEAEKEKIIHQAAEKYGEFLTALGCDWKNDPNSNDTPRRVAKAYVNDLWKGRYELPPDVTEFPPDGYDGLAQQSWIPVTSMCSHHHQTIKGKVHIAYIPQGNGGVVGLSKLNRIVEYFARRGAIQEQLTVAIHNAIDTICEGNIGVAVMIDATHNCVSCRGVKHQGASMQTAKLSGAFLEEPSTKAEFYKNVELSKRKDE